MELKIKTFGVARDMMGGKEVVVKVAGSDVASLRRALMTNYPALEKLRSLFIAVNQQYAEDNQSINETDEIALIPPVSGG
ncbi:MAG: MoaD/ThiS family protein [Chryseotalea sp. WA131a]|jgi:molybdopterin synthase sulfur carrier subunit|nr:MAG: MoaD/ThiS family protein [Chryseotalea sp. WA131a]